MTNLRYIFFGGQESPFATIILDKLTKAGMPPLASIRNAKLPLDPDHLKSFGADFFLVAAFGKILKKEILNISPIGLIRPIGPIPVIGVHPSLLPKYRGASPIQSAILNNEKETGTAIFLIDEKVDHGPILITDKLQITADDNYTNLQKKLAELSADLILGSIPKWLRGEIKPTAQNEAEATFTKKFTTEDALIDLQKEDPRKIWLKIRALNPEPGTYAVLKLKNGKDLRLKILKSDFADGRLKIEEVQPDGKKAMRFKDFLNGYGKNLADSDLKNLS